MTFGEFLKILRDEKGFKIRELARLSQQDPAYVYRLEAGEKSAPSEDVLKSLIRSLKPDGRRTHILRLLAEQEEVEDAIIELALERQDTPIEDFESAARASFRDSAPRTKDQWWQYIQGITKAREAIERG